MKQSAGLLVFRKTDGKVEVLLVHPGGPFWSKKDVWSIPKGEVDEGEDLEKTMIREFEEETGFEKPKGEFIDLGLSKQAGKTNYIWAIEGDADIGKFKCESTFNMEWPPNSGSRQDFAENDKAAWFDLATAKRKLFKGQIIFIDRLAEKINIEMPDLPEQQTLV